MLSFPICFKSIYAYVIWECGTGTLFEDVSGTLDLLEKILKRFFLKLNFKPPQR